MIDAYRDDVRMQRRLARKEARQRQRKLIEGAKILKAAERKRKRRFYVLALTGGVIGNILYHIITWGVHFVMSR